MIKPIMHEPRLLQHVNFAINLLGASRSISTKVSEVLSNPAKEKEGRGEAKEERGGEAEEETGGRGEAEERGRG